MSNGVLEFVLRTHARIVAGAARAHVEAAAMLEANAAARAVGALPPYAPEDFKALINENGIDWNSVVEAFR